MVSRLENGRVRLEGAARYMRVAVFHFWVSLIAAVVLVVGVGGAQALEAIVVDPKEDRIEITTRGVVYDNRGDRFQVETAAGRNNVVGRMTVRATTEGTNPSWIVFALTNPSDERQERWLTASRYSIVGSGAVWPDLDARRIEAVTPSVGFLPERLKSDRADVFRITLEPGQTITYVAELSSERYARVHLWKPLAYELKVRERQLFNGIMLGLTGLLAIFLTVIFAANHKAIFPSAALVAWCVLAYLCVEFGFFHKLFNLRPEDNAVYRAAGESAIAASLVIFLHTFLRLRHSIPIIRMLFAVWILAQLALVAIAVIDPRLAATFARLSFILIGAVGTVFTLYLAFKGQDRAISLIPTWIALLVWTFAAAVTITGRLSGDIVEASLVGGVTLMVVLLGFTVTQFAFGSLEPAYGAAPSEQSLRALAVDCAGVGTFDWNNRRDEVRVGAFVEAALGLNSGELSTSVSEFLKYVHPSDRDRFKMSLLSAQERGGGRLNADFRLRHSDNTYRWFDLEAGSVQTTDRSNVRCVGLLRDVTDDKRSQERLLRDAVNCSLTGLPNRELLLDRLSVACQRAKTEVDVRPTVIVVDIDRFKGVNDSLGLHVGDSLLLTVARRLQRHLEANDTLSRIGGDQFAILITTQQEARELASLAERIRRSLRSPIKIAGREVVLTGSLGIAIYDGEEEGPEDLLKAAELAMYRAKRSGADKIEMFRQEMREDQNDRSQMERDLRTALQNDQLKVSFQPIIYLPTEELAGFEALVRWQHPKKGLIGPDEFVPVAEQSDLINKLGSYVLNKATSVAAGWQKILPRQDDPLFLSVNISSRQLLRQELVHEVRHVINKSAMPRGTLRLEITESLVMSNPERSVDMLNQLRSAGAKLALDDFGSGYSSLSYLQRLPVDTIKLDKGFIQHSDENVADSAIVRSVVALCHELGKSIVAEGVETPEDAGFLRSIGCEYAQGFYYGEPMDVAHVNDLLWVIRKSERRLEANSFFRTRGNRRKKAAKQKPKAGAGDVVQAHVNGADARGQGAAPQRRPTAQARPGNGGPPRRPSGEAGPVATALPRSTVRRLPRTHKPDVGESRPVGSQESKLERQSVRHGQKGGGERTASHGALSPSAGAGKPTPSDIAPAVSGKVKEGSVGGMRPSPPVGPPSVPNSRPKSPGAQPPVPPPSSSQPSPAPPKSPVSAKPVPAKPAAMPPGQRTVPDRPGGVSARGKSAPLSLGDLFDGKGQPVPAKDGVTGGQKTAPVMDPAQKKGRRRGSQPVGQNKVQSTANIGAGPLPAPPPVRPKKDGGFSKPQGSNVQSTSRSASRAPVAAQSSVGTAAAPKVTAGAQRQDAQNGGQRRVPLKSSSRDLSALPPGIRASLERLAGSSRPPRGATPPETSAPPKNVPPKDDKSGQKRKK